MEPYEFFLVPIRDDKAQVVIMALMLLALMDVLFGVVNAMFVQHDFSSHEFRAGLIRKLGNLGMVAMADIIDAILLGGVDLDIQPVLMTIAISLSVMEVMSLLEIFAEMHPEISDTPWYQMLAHSKESLNK